MNNPTNNLTESQRRNLELLKVHGEVTYSASGKANHKGFHETALCGLVDMGLVAHSSTKVMIPNYVPAHLKHNPKFAHLNIMVESFVQTYTLISAEEVTR